MATINMTNELKQIIQAMQTMTPAQLQALLAIVVEVDKKK